MSRRPAIALAVGVAVVVAAAVWAAPPAMLKRDTDTRTTVVGHSKQARLLGVTPGISLPTVSAERLAASGVALTAPTTLPLTPKNEAVAKAVVESPEGRGLDARYLHCSLEGVRPPLDRDCWVISVDPRGVFTSGPPEAERHEMAFMVVFIDGQTGELIVGVSGT